MDTIEEQVDHYVLIGVGVVQMLCKNVKNGRMRNQFRTGTDPAAMVAVGSSRVCVWTSRRLSALGLVVEDPTTSPSGFGCSVEFSADGRIEARFSVGEAASRHRCLPPTVLRTLGFEEVAEPRASSGAVFLGYSALRPEWEEAAFHGLGDRQVRLFSRGMMAPPALTAWRQGRHAAYPRHRSPSSMVAWITCRVMVAPGNDGRGCDQPAAGGGTTGTPLGDTCSPPNRHVVTVAALRPS